MNMSRRTRWIPALVAPVLVAAGAVAVPVVADADPGLPEKSAQQVLELAASSEADQFSGTVEQTSELGLPDLPATGGSEGSGAMVEALTQPHTVRVFADGEDRSRVQVLDDMAERDLIRNGDDLWFWSSEESKAVHSTVPEHETPARPEGVPATPAELAEELLAGIDESTEVSVSGTGMVADRPVYQLRLDPRSADTLVDVATLSVDAETGMPLSVQLQAVGQQAPAFTVGFTSIDFSAPDADLFEFTPPADAQILEETLPTPGEHGNAEKQGDDTGKAGRGDRPEVSGEGWARVVEMTADGADAAAMDDPMLQQLTVPAEGGRALQTSLLSVLLTDDGRVFAGAVPVDQLVAAAR